MAFRVSVQLGAYKTNLKSFINNQTNDDYWNRIHEFFINKSRCACNCKEHPIPLNLIEKDGFFELTSVPGTETMHDVRCSFFRDPTLTSVEKPIIGALTERIKRIQVNCELPNIEAPADVGEPEDDYWEEEDDINFNIDPDATPIQTYSRQGLFHFILENAFINHFQPKTFTFSRSRKHTRVILRKIYQSLKVVRVWDEPLTKAVGVVTPHRDNKNPSTKKMIHHSFEKMFQQSDSPTPNPTMIVIGKLIETLQADDGTYQGRFKYCDDVIHIDPVEFANFAKNYQFELARLAADDDTSCLIFADVERREEGVYFASKIIAIAMSRDFIPIYSLDEARLANTLIDQERYFRKPLNFGDTSQCLPNFEMTDTAIPFQPLRIDNEAVSHQDTASETWIWNPSRDIDVPAFPEKGQLPVENPKTETKKQKTRVQTRAKSSTSRTNIVTSKRQVTNPSTVGESRSKEGRRNIGALLTLRK